MEGLYETCRQVDVGMLPAEPEPMIT